MVPELKQAQRIHDCFDARHFMGAEYIRLTERCEHGKEGLSTADFFPEVLERMGQRVANWKSQRVQAEGVQENAHLVSHADGAVLKIPIIEPKAGVDDDLVHAMSSRQLDLAREIILHQSDGVGPKIKITYFANIPALDVTNNH